MAVKLVDLLVRKDDWTHEEFVEYWQGDHAELAEQLPGLRKYVTSVPKDPEKAGYDGMLELYFDDTAAIGEAFESEIGREVQADAAKFVNMDEGPTLIVEESVQLDELDE
ncbi:MULTISPECIES: EthD family reductase [Halorussus]|uniref:EthD family reductase n=1 Tax=Halorussus TaxID=1070314 RepID=UPI0020A068BB|nr:EthD family reductase [Halorussus vallis]USZ76310.1 EthD family reductase [Halorussus vallis]